jgi:hypothetical protein
MKRCRVNLAHLQHPASYNESAVMVLRAPSFVGTHAATAAGPAASRLHPRWLAARGLSEPNTVGLVETVRNRVLR